MKENINNIAVFYTKNNMKRILEIKKIFRNSNKFTLLIANYFSELLYSLGKYHVQLLLIDGETVELTDDFESMQTDGGFGVPDNILYLGFKENNFNVDNRTKFCITYESLFRRLVPLKDRILLNIREKSSLEFDIKVVNQFMSEYLIRLGFVPKLMGFNYIKQCIEESICNNCGILGSLSTEVYPRVASRNKTSAVNIERNIRSSINNAIKNSDAYSGINGLFNNAPISNRAFLAYLLDQVLINCTQYQQSINF